jgi:enoyl-CoA hydratase
VNRLVEEPALEAAFSFAKEFSGYGLLAQQFVREAVHRSSDTTLVEGLRMEADLSTLAYRTADADEGMQAFVDKRKPVFRDR